MGVLGNFRESVTIVNRSNRDLNVRYDGEDITLKPGDNPGFPLVAVPFAKKQNPMKGTLHPNGNLNSQVFLVGVRGTKDNCEMLDVETLNTADAKLEAFDRDGSIHGEPMANVKLMRKNKTYPAYEAAAAIGTFDNNNDLN